MPSNLIFRIFKYKDKKIKVMTNSNTFSISNQSQFDECLMWVSDLYKDVYGIRPRGYNFHNWSFQELTDFVNDLSEENSRLIDEEKAFEQGS